MKQFKFLIFVICLTFGSGLGFSEEKTKKPDDSDRYFVNFEPVTIPIVTDDNRGHRIRIMFRVEVFSSRDREDVEEKSPKIRGEILQVLYREMFLKLNETKDFSIEDIDVVSFNDFLKDVTKKILPKDMEHDVYVVQMSYRAL